VNTVAVVAIRVVRKGIGRAQIHLLHSALADLKLRLRRRRNGNLDLQGKGDVIIRARGTAGRDWSSVGPNADLSSFSATASVTPPLATREQQSGDSPAGVVVWNKCESKMCLPSAVSVTHTRRRTALIIFDVAPVVNDQDVMKVLGDDFIRAEAGTGG
jgi:hypothetical protein